MFVSKSVLTTGTNVHDNDGFRCFIDTNGFVMEPEMLQQAHLKTGITKPHPHDILSGRGNDINMHLGNQYFRSCVRHFKNEYVITPKPDKPAFAKLIFKRFIALDPPGRFLKKNGREHWEDMGEKKAIEKIRQALREDAGKVKKEIENGKRRVITSVRRNIIANDAPRNLLDINSSTATQSPTTGQQSETSYGTNFTRSSNCVDVNNSIHFHPEYLNKSLVSTASTRNDSMHSKHSQPPKEASLRNSVTSTQFTSLPRYVSLTDESINSNHFRASALSKQDGDSFTKSVSDQSIKANKLNHSATSSDLNQSLVSDGFANPLSLNLSSSNPHIVAQTSSMVIQPQDSIIMSCQVPGASNFNNDVPARIVLNQNLNGPIPIPNMTSSFRNSSLGSVPETSKDETNHDISGSHIATISYCQQSYRNVNCEEEEESETTDEEESELEEFLSGSTSEEAGDGEEEFLPESSSQDEFVPGSFYDFSNGQQVTLTNSFRRDSGYSRSSMLMESIISILENLDDTIPGENDEGKEQSKSKRKFTEDHIEKLQNLRNSLNLLDDNLNQDYKKVDRRNSNRVKSLLRRRSSIIEPSIPHHQESIRQNSQDIVDPISDEDILVESMAKSLSQVIDNKLSNMLNGLSDEDREGAEGLRPLNSCENGMTNLNLVDEHKSNHHSQ
jgi:hypothetical protein